MTMMKIAEALMERNAAPDWITRIGIRKLLAERLVEESSATIEEEMRHKMEMVQSLGSNEIAIKQEKANEQHYEVPTELFEYTLGKRMKYSSCYYESADASLNAAEESMLRLYCQRAGLKDGMSVLDLGCGWGSLTLYIAENYPKCKIRGLSNSWTQRKFIEEEARKKGFKNVTITTADISKIDRVEGCSTFDMIFSIEMFEHMKNYGDLLKKMSSWMHKDSKLFIHIFCHIKYIYNFETEGATNWMGRYFFTGGTMASDDVLNYFQDHVKVVERWRVDGRHYAQTSEHWLQNFDRNIEKIRPILRSTYGEEATKWEAYWRTFYLAVAELFGYNNGQEWHVAHYLMAKRS
eukprot:TRINITY_DN300_c0_g1_i1.p1 TRINITY_DN300_c0_g1~~TRINITY_DN300_c0_g1_i1.p1  ORF type:complete len:350 (+),score=60.18 TRINITY_DN300_c0_g1_i1:303-1352(+)